MRASYILLAHRQDNHRHATQSAAGVWGPQGAGAVQGGGSKPHGARLRHNDQDVAQQRVARAGVLARRAQRLPPRTTPASGRCVRLPGPSPGAPGACTLPASGASACLPGLRPPGHRRPHARQSLVRRRNRRAQRHGRAPSAGRPVQGACARPCNISPRHLAPPLF